jgi:hypothetical protein
MQELDQYVMAAFVLIGLVNGIKLLESDKKGFAYFCVAVVTGTIFGAFQLFGLPSLEVGLAIGISSSGVYKLAQKFGGE